MSPRFEPAAAVWPEVLRFEAAGAVWPEVPRFEAAADDDDPVVSIVDAIAVERETGADRWPRLPDDRPQWTVVARRDARDRDRYLDEEQRGLAWNA
ncbi:hypothetical protein [Dactylosporangium sp. CA-092794]|uniref:hypothetical protein n=1 Tax=Dactylosporangium sp. CA-092794 TaxID=3239929 RepID=UPI003D8BCFC0